MSIHPPWYKRLAWCTLLLCVLPLHEALAQVDDLEPNDTPGQAVEITTPYFYTNGSISFSGDKDYFSFSAVAGQEVTIWVRAASIESDLVPTLALYNGASKLLAYSDEEWNLNTGAMEHDPILYLRIPSTGTYFILVTAAETFHDESVDPGAAIGHYGLSFAPKFGLAIADPNEPNNTLGTATLVSIPYQSFRANLLYFGDTDWYRLYAKKGERISVDVDALEMESEPGWEMIAAARIGIFDETGQLLENLTTGIDPDTGFEEDPAILFEAPREGKYYVVVAAQLDNQFGQLYNNPEFLSDPEVSSTEHRIGNYRVLIRHIDELFFPQVANGSFGAVYFTTSIILVNPSSDAVTGSVAFYGSGGLEMETSFLTIEGELSSNRFNIPPKGTLVLRSDGSGPGMSGYARVVATGPLGGSVVFSEYDLDGTLITEAAVGASSPMEFFTFPVDVTGGFNTGIAMANPTDATDINLYIKLLNQSGETVATKALTLEAGRQIAIYISGPGQLFPNVVNFRGCVQVFADAGLPAVALRSTQRTMTTLPPVAINQPFEEGKLYFPQVVVGAGENDYRSTLIFTNPGYFPVSGHVEFRRSDGTPMEVTMGSTTDSIHSFSMPPQGTLFLESKPTDDLQVGYAVLMTNHVIGAAVIFSQYDASTGDLQTEVGVPAALLAKRFLVFVEHADNYNTGIALANVSQDISDLDYLLHQGGVSSHLGPVALNPGEHEAVLVAGPAQLFPDFAGIATLEVNASQWLPAVALRLTATTMTALPVIPVPEN